MLGAIYLTGFLGGAVATHYRVGSPLGTHVLFGVYMGVVMWTGLLLRYLALLRVALAPGRAVDATDRALRRVPPDLRASSSSPILDAQTTREETPRCSP